MCVEAKAGEKPKPNCIRCHVKPAHCKGKLCWKCSNAGKRGDVPASNKPAVGAFTRLTDPEHGPSSSLPVAPCLADAQDLLAHAAASNSKLTSTVSAPALPQSLAALPLPSVPFVSGPSCSNPGKGGDTL